jgi:hypothetical protein
VATGVSGSSLTFSPPPELIAEDLRVRVVASDGLNTATGVSPSFAIRHSGNGRIAFLADQPADGALLWTPIGAEEDPFAVRRPARRRTRRDGDPRGQLLGARAVDVEPPRSSIRTGPASSASCPSTSPGLPTVARSPTSRTTRSWCRSSTAPIDASCMTDPGESSSGPGPAIAWGGSTFHVTQPDGSGSRVIYEDECCASTNDRSVIWAPDGSKLLLVLSGQRLAVSIPTAASSRPSRPATATTTRRIGSRCPRPRARRR